MNTLTNQRILLVCHASKQMGIGHLSRSLVLADALKQQDVSQINILVFGEAVTLQGNDKFTTKFLPLYHDFTGSVKNEVEELTPTIVVFDLHPQSLPPDFRELLTWLISHDVHRIGIDGLVDFCCMLDLIWIPSFFVDSDKLKNCPGNVIYGWDSYLIRKLLPDSDWKHGNDVLVLTGGSDPRKLGDVLPQKLDITLPENTVVHWVQGPFAKPPNLTKKQRLKWIIHDSPKGLDKLIVQSNYVLSVYGVSFFEVLQYGIPTVVFSPYDEKDNKELNELGKFNIAEVADDMDSAVLKLSLLMKSKVRAYEFSVNSKGRLKVNGAYHLATRIISMMRH